MPVSVDKDRPKFLDIYSAVRPASKSESSSSSVVSSSEGKHTVEDRPAVAWPP